MAKYRHGVCYLRLALLSFLIALASDTHGTDHPPPTADHSKFELLRGPFRDATEVTQACLTCHTEAAEQIRNTTHWTWTYHHPETGQILGKRHVINSFCGAPITNEPRCTSCHVGYGWTDLKQPPPAADTAVDCLVCHDTTGEYRKFPTLAGFPTNIPREWPTGSGTIVEPPDLARIARNVGASSRANCGSCHFYGGGGDGVKHGDLDSSLVNPPRSLDVHMSPEGLNFVCSDCHTSWGHKVAGSRYQVNARDTLGIDVPGHTDFSRASCESCHGTAPHEWRKINDHVDTLACQTCHIPAFARGGVPTKMWWDWSTAGRLDAEGKPLTEYDENGNVRYLSAKGDFRWEENVVPEYAWFDGTVEYTLPDDKLDLSQQPIGINRIDGGPEDPDSRIWPFKVMKGKQPYDTKYQTLLVTHVFGDDDTALWSNFNWPKALKAGSEMSGVPFSGHYDFVETRMYWPITHMVPPADQALKCQACHSVQSRLAGLPGIYMPGHHHSPHLDRLGWLVVGVVLLSVLLHTIARLALKRRKSS